MWPLDGDAAAARRSKRGRGGRTDTLIPALPLPAAPWIRPRPTSRYPDIDREELHTKAQYAGGALIGAWLLRRLLGGGGARRQRGGGRGGGGSGRRRSNHDSRQPGLLATLIGALFGAGCVYRARGGDLQARAAELRDAAARGLRDAERAVAEHARAAERQIAAAMRDAEAELVPALRAEAEQGRLALERSMREVERAVQEAADAAEAEARRGRGRRRAGGADDG